MKNLVITILGVLLLVAAQGCDYERVSMWGLECAACHDGKTVLNDKVMPDRQALKAKYATLREFEGSCQGASACMNILKHDPKLFRDVGREIGIPEK